MKKLNILLLFIWFNSISQNNIKLDEDLYQSGLNNYEIFIDSGEDQDLKLSFECFKIIILNFPNSIHYNKALFYVGNFEFAENKLEDSKKHLNEFILISEPGYEKRLAYFNLAEIAILENDNVLIEKYLDVILKSDPKVFLCGNAREQDSNRVKYILEKAKKNQK